MDIEPHHSSEPRARRARRGFAATLAALGCITLLSACGSSGSSTSAPGAKTNLDTARVAASIEESILKERHLHSKVVCPAIVPQEVGHTFNCVATTQASKTAPVLHTTFVVTIKTPKGYVEYEGK